MAKKPSQLHIIADGTGGLPRHILTVILSQFPSWEAKPRYHVFCSSIEKIQQVFRESIRKDSIVLHALADAASKSCLIEMADKKKVPHYDLTGGLVSFLAEHSGLSAADELARVHARDEDYFDRIDAWEYTMQHDDSRRLESIHKADIVLVGLSRVSKTPTSAYLGWLGHRVANVSFVPESGLPQEIRKCKDKVVALTMQPRRLAEIRSRRMRVNGFEQAVQAEGSEHEFRYAGLRDTIREVMAAEAIYKQLKLPIIDVTDSTVEENAAKILETQGRS